MSGGLGCVQLTTAIAHADAVLKGQNIWLSLFWFSWSFLG